MHTPIRFALPAALLGACLLTAAPAAAADDHAAAAQNADANPIESLDFLVGDWEGTLTYLNYGDNTSTFSLPTKAAFTAIENGVMGAYSYTEPNGTVVTSESPSLLLEEGRLLRLGAGDDAEEYEVTVTVSEPGSYRLFAMMEGEDNGVAGTIGIELRLAGETLEIIKRVTPADGSDPYVRNRYTFTRAE